MGFPLLRNLNVGKNPLIAKARSYLVAHPLPHSKEVEICTPLRASILSRPTVVKCGTC